MKPGMRVRLIGQVWGREWIGLTGTVGAEDQDYPGLFSVLLDVTDATGNDRIFARDSEVEEILR